MRWFFFCWSCTHWLGSSLWLQYTARKQPSTHNRMISNEKVSRAKDLSDTHVKVHKVWKGVCYREITTDSKRPNPISARPFELLLTGTTSGTLRSPCAAKLNSTLKNAQISIEVQKIDLWVWWWENAPTTFQNPDTCLGNLEVEVTQSYKLSHNRMRGLFSKAFFFLKWCEHIYLKV